jgi:hypothetical protein
MLKGLRQSATGSRLAAAGSQAPDLPPLLFSGQAGAGKRTAALLFARSVNCASGGCGECDTCRTIGRLLHPDVRLIFPVKQPARREATPEDHAEALVAEYPSYQLAALQPALDARLSISIQLVRWLRSELTKPPSFSRVRFVIILHAHRLTPEAAASLLKTLEEPHRQTAFVLTTDSPAALPDTVRSRCRVLRFADVERTTLAAWLKSRTHCSDREAALAAEASQGSPGRALRALEGQSGQLAKEVREFAARPPAQPPVPRDLIALLDRAPATRVAAILLAAMHAPTGTTGLATARPPVGALRDVYDRMDRCGVATNPNLTSYTLFAGYRRAWLGARR